MSGSNTNSNNGNNNGGGGGLLGVLGAVIAVITAIVMAITYAFTMGFGGAVLTVIAIFLGRHFSRVRTGTRDDDKPIYTRIRFVDLFRYIWSQRLKGIPAGRVSLLLAPVTAALALVPWQPLLGSAVGAMISNGLLVAGVTAGTLVIVSALTVARRYRRQVLARLAERAKITGSLRYIAGMSESAWADASWELEKATSSIVIYSPPEAVAAAQKNVDRISQEMPGWTIDRERSGQTAVLREETAEESRRRQLAASSDGLVLNVAERGDGNFDLQLAAGISPTRAEHVEAWLQNTSGLSLVAWEPLYSRAIAGKMTDADRTMRTRIATLLGVHPHEVTLKVSSDAEGVVALAMKAPAGRAVDGESRVAQMRRVMKAVIPEAHDDWIVTVDTVTDITKMERRARLVLPQQVALSQVLPATNTPAEWANISVGIDAFGRPVGQVLTAAPMSLVVGPTGSGKTIYLLADAVGRLTRGHDLLIVDPSKGGVDFSSLEPYTLGFARTFASSVAAIKAIYAEGQRRKDVLLREGAVKWADLSQEVRDAENIKPVTVLIDEVASLLIQVQVPKGLPKDDPDFLEAQELSNQKTLLAMYLGKVARECRFVGIFLLIAMQRPDATILGGEVRSNFSHRVQLVPPGKPVGRTELEMLFPAPIVGAVWDAVNRFDDGNPGLAVMAGDEGDVAPARIGFTEMHEVPKLLAARGVHPVDPARKLPLAPVAAPAAAATPVPAPAVDDLGDLFA